MTVSLKADVFPADVIIDPGSPHPRTVNRVRVLIVEASTPDTCDRIAVYADSGEGPRLVYSQPISDYTPPVRARRLREAYSPETRLHQATLLSGTPVTFERASGCGCGSRLKSFNPFPSLASLSASPA